jgi:phospholipid/cholesterol/gamma-HCH transport system substrate-binding protein
MLNRRVNYALVGLFVILLGLTWLGITLWLALGDYSTHYKTYRVYLDESVAGLYLDAPVKYRGVEVGKVSRIELNPSVPDQVQLTLDVEASAPIRVDTEAQLAVQGLTGIAFVDLKGGALDSPLLKAEAGQDYPVIKSSPSFFTRLDMSGTELIANINTIASRLAQLLDDQGRKSAHDILANLGVITGTIAKRSHEIDQTLVNTARLAENSAKASDDLQPMLAQAHDTARAFQAMAEKVAALSDSLNHYVGGSGSGVQQFSRQVLPEVGTLISELRSLADSLRTVSGKLEDDPSVLLYGNQLEVPGPGERK